MGLRYSAKGWLAVFGVVGAIEYFAPPNDTLSHGADVALEHPVGKLLVPAVVMVTALHIINRLPVRYDPYSRAFALLKGEATPSGILSK